MQPVDAGITKKGKILICLCNISKYYVYPKTQYTSVCTHHIQLQFTCFTSQEAYKNECISYEFVQFLGKVASYYKNFEDPNGQADGCIINRRRSYSTEIIQIAVREVLEGKLSIYKTA
jgi:hypothetical protein